MVIGGGLGESSTAWERLRKSLLPHGFELPGGFMEEVGSGRTKGACGDMGAEEFFRIGGGMSIDALVGEERDLVLYAVGDGEPVKGFQNGGDVVVFSRSC